MVVIEEHNTIDTYNFDRDQRWKLHRQNYLASKDHTNSNPSTSSTDAPPPPLSASEEWKFKQQYYKQYVDPAYIITESLPTSMRSKTSLPFSTPSFDIAIIHAFVHVLVLASAVRYMLPIIGDYHAFYHVLNLSIAALIIHLWRKHFSTLRSGTWTAAGKTLISDEQTQFLGGAFVLKGMPTPVFVAMLPYVIRSALFLARYLHRVGPSKLGSANYARIKPVVDALVTKNKELQQQNSVFEILTGVMLLFTVTQHFILTIIYWQWLRIRYMLSPNSRVAFSTIRLKIDTLLQASFVPPIVRQVWGSLCSYLHSMADINRMQATGPGAGGGMPRCTIM